MKIEINEKAAEWYKKELHLEDGSFVRFFPRYGGVGGNIPGFSIGINVNKPVDLQTKTVSKGITFYVEKEDEWYFEKKNLIIDYDTKLKEPRFIYE